MPVGELLEYAWARTRQQLHSLSCGLIVRDWLDGSDALCARDDQREQPPVYLRALFNGQIHT